MSSRAEQITSEVKRLVLKCRKLEADLAQSVPKKVLDENVAKLQAKIDALKQQKNSMDTGNYKAQLTVLLIQLAQTQAEIDK